MSFTDLLSISGTILATFGGGALIVFGLSKWLGGVWANRTLENEKFTLQLQQDLLIRRRDIYAKLAVALRVFLSNSAPASAAQREEFLNAHDEAFLWASEDVCDAVGQFLDLQVQFKNNQNNVAMTEMQSAYQKCLSSMRKDAGFPKSSAQFRIVSF